MYEGEARGGKIICDTGLREMFVRRGAVYVVDHLNN